MPTNTNGRWLQAVRTRLGYACAAALVVQFAGCAPSGDLAEANRKLELANHRIAELEVQLTTARPGTTLAARPGTPALASTADRGSAAPPLAQPGTRIAAPPSTEQPELVTAGQQWRYDATEQQMSGGERRTASVESTNTVSLDFPYSGPQNGHLTLRIDPQYGKDVIFRLEKGQILCSPFEGCTVQVRFDDEKPVNFGAAAAADHSSNLVFLNDYNRFFVKLRKAKRIRLSVDIYQHGRPVFEFDVSGFDLDKYQPKRS